MQKTPNNAIYASARSHYVKGDLRAAIAILKDAVTKQPQFYEGWLFLSKCLFDAGYFKESVQIGQHAEQFDPLQDDFREIQQNMQKNAYGQAQRLAQQMLKRQVNHPRAIFTLAHIASVTNDPFHSIQILKQGLNDSPANLMLRHMLMTSQESAGDFAEAIDTARYLVRIDESFNTLWALITLLLKLGQHADLINLCERAQSLSGLDKVKHSQIDLVRGQTLRIMGKRQDSIEAFRASLATNPKNAEAWWALADMKTFEFSDKDRNNIQALLSDPSISQETKCLATFALAKANESSNNWDAIMHLYHQANRLKNTNNFDLSHVEQELKARAKTFTSDVLSIQANQIDTDPTPIFIVGLPRSGSTLIEQILASHSHIEGTFEQPTMPCIEKQAQALCAQKFNNNLFAALGSLSPDDLSHLGQAYLTSGRLFRSAETPFFVDKLPFNFRHIGLIHKILPNAIIIDVRRNPLDCGFSLYKQYFASGVDFSYELTHIGTFYNSYVRLMAHWKRVLPNKILSIQYEALIASPEQHIRRLLRHIGVNYETQCLHFHNTPRMVHTASSEQVRQPINSMGIDAWRKAENSLSALADSLGTGSLK